ncbi:MAG: NAD(P)-binding protein, partial [Caldimonas sp.]
MTREIAVVGAGWAGLAAAVEAATAGARVTLFEMAPQAGGRARSVASDASTRDEGAGPATRLDNGQHICIGAYTETLRLLRQVGVTEQDAFVRAPLTLVDSRGFGLRLRAGPPLPAFILAVLRRRGWRWRDRLALLMQASRWSRDGFRCDAAATVAHLCQGLPAAVQREFIEPLCVAALNTPVTQASGSVFLRVLNDALTSGTGSADLLLPRLDLGAIFPEPALA